MRKIGVIGLGYVGLVTGTCFADLGNRVYGIDINTDKITKLQKGKAPLFEPGLEEMVERNMQRGRLFFTTSYEEGLKDVDFIFIAVDTPSGQEGEADLRAVRQAAGGVAELMSHPFTIVNKSTVPIGTGDWVAETVSANLRPEVEFSVVSNPEFLREGSAIHDFLNPDRIVLGSTDRRAAERVAELYTPLGRPVMITDLRTAEMIKYASNAFLATRISFINEIAAICEKLGADVKQVAAGMGLDHRIGPDYLDAGLGWGGSCFPKDVRALAHMAAIHGAHPQLLRAVMDINQDQRRRVVRTLREILGTLHGKNIGLLGLAYKPNTDDLREAPALEIVHLLTNEGAKVVAYDPVAMDNARNAITEVEYKNDPYEVARGSDGLLVITEWNEFKHLDMGRIQKSMRQAVLIDGRNIYDPDAMRQLGFIYRGIGRGYGETNSVAEELIAAKSPATVSDSES
ncbi:MAG: UDP-glucose/GDP-mannose dehydrogenase family protein [Chloroflexi bacterium]|nr:UDP-glucose/GDP-mannose dehydrogenase family protein [Chloroflexota bacterium]